MDPKSQGLLWFLLACSLALAAQIFLFSPIESPQTLVVPASALLTPTNNHLQRVIKLGQGLLKGPEDIAVDKEGVLYTGTRDGWIKRLHKNGTWEDWKMIGGHGLLGLTMSYQQGTILVCDADKGLLKVGEDGVTVLSSHVNGSKLRLADDVIEAWDGSAYFTEASTKFGGPHWHLDMLEAKPHGLLLKYDPSSKHTSILIDALFFPNGVALSKHQDFLVVCETWKYRCVKYWLSGINKGTTEIFIENLPGAPDNINIAPDGSFWIGLIKLSSRGREMVHTSKVFKYVIASFPNLLNAVMGIHKQATAIKVDEGGNIIDRVDDPDGTVMPFVTSALEFDNHLYLGSLHSDFVGKLPLKDA